MDNAIEVVVEEQLWDQFDLAKMASCAFDAICAKLTLANGPYEFSVLACNDARIAVLNAEFRGKETATNVLSWPTYDLSLKNSGQAPNPPAGADFGDPYVNIGDIAIAYETCLQEAQDAALEPKDHITHLLIHGILHLLGYDHVMDTDAELMENMEIEILAGLAIGNPYQNV